MDDFPRRLNDVIIYQPDPDDSGTILEVSPSGDDN